MEKILIVDDEEPIRKLLMRYLGTGNYDCVLAADAVEARSRLEEEEFDVILCDINMPGESGLDLVRDLRGRRADLAAVMVTGADEPAIAKTAFEVGAYDYIVKPLEQNRVLISVTNALHRRDLEVVVGETEGEAQPSRITEESVRDARLRDLVEKEPALGEAVKELDLELLD